MLWRLFEDRAGSEADVDQLKLRQCPLVEEEYSYAVRAKDVDGELLDIGQSCYRIIPQPDGDLLFDFNSQIPGLNYAEKVKLLVDHQLHPRRLTAAIEVPRGNYEVDVQYERFRVRGEIAFQSAERGKIERSLTPVTYDSYEHIEILRRWDYSQARGFYLNLVNVVKGAYNRYLVRFNGLGPLRLGDVEYDTFRVSMEKVTSGDENRFVQYYWFSHEPPHQLLRHVKAAQILELISDGR